MLSESLKNIFLLKLRDIVGIVDIHVMCASLDMKTIAMLGNANDDSKFNNTVPAIYVFRKINNKWQLLNIEIIYISRRYIVTPQSSMVITGKGDKILLGLPMEYSGIEDKYIRTGVVRIYDVKDYGLRLDTTIVSSDSKEDDMFGYGVEINNDASSIVISAPCASSEEFNECGKVYFYNRKESGDIQLVNIESGKRENCYLGNTRSGRTVSVNELFATITTDHSATTTLEN